MDVSESLALAIQTVVSLPADDIADVTWSLFVRANSSRGRAYPPDFLADLSRAFDETSSDVLGELWVEWATRVRPAW